MRAAARARRESRQAEESLRADRRRRGAARGRSAPRTAPRSTRRRRSRTSSSARTRRRPSRRRSSSSTRRPRPRAPPRSSSSSAKERRAAVQLAFDKLEKSIIRERIAVHKKRPDGRARGRDPRHLDRSRRHAAHARLGAVHARPDAGAERRRAGHAQGGDAPRHARPGDEKVLLAPLQLPAVLGRGGGPHGRRQAPRHRPRRARRAGARADDPLDRGVPLLDPRRLGHPRVQRLLLDGLGLRLLAVADGRRACRSSARSPASRWA